MNETEPAPEQPPLDEAPAEVAETETEPLIEPGQVPADLRDVEDYKPGEAELAVADPSDIFRAFDRADEVMILEELQGKVLETWVYSFPVDGKEQTDLTVYGVNEVVRLLNRQGRRIRIAPMPPEVSEFEQEGERYVRVLVYAEDQQDGSGDWGVATEPLFFTPHRGRNKGKRIWDKFALTKALNKAGRNAKKKLISEEYRQTIIATALQDESRVRRLKSVAEVTATELPDAAVGPEADALRAQIRETYDEIREISTMVVTPGQYQAYFTRSDHAVERLAEMHRWLREELARAKEIQAKDAEQRKGDDDE